MPDANIKSSAAFRPPVQKRAMKAVTCYPYPKLMITQPVRSTHPAALAASVDNLWFYQNFD
jgi:hypothetical protein